MAVHYQRSSGRHRSAVRQTPRASSRIRASAASRRSALALRQSLTVVFAFTAAAAFVLVNLVSPYSTDMASAAYSTTVYGNDGGQGVTTSGEYTVSANGETYVSDKKAGVTVNGVSFNLPQVVPDPGSAQAIAHDMVLGRGWDENEFSCLVDLWNHESGWRVNAGNPVSGAYGIPQALPGTKMAAIADDWATNPATQIIWGLNYVSGRYGTPCGALAGWQSKGWY